MRIVAILGFILFRFNKNSDVKIDPATSSAIITCSFDKQKYLIEYNSDHYFKCDNCSEKIENDLKEIIDFDNFDESVDNVIEYFEQHNGTCE